MEFWSKGLGRHSLVLEFGGQEIESDEERVVLSGRVARPVTWNYIMYLELRDWLELFELALRPPVGSYLWSGCRAGALPRLGLFLMRFVFLYLGSLLRVRLGMAAEPVGVKAMPDLRARPEIDEAALQSRGPGPGRSSSAGRV